jgi:hypothetical protein
MPGPVSLRVWPVCESMTSFNSLCSQGPVNARTYTFLWITWWAQKFCHCKNYILHHSLSSTPIPKSCGPVMGCLHSSSTYGGVCISGSVPTKREGGGGGTFSSPVNNCSWHGPEPGQYSTYEVELLACKTSYRDN